MSVKKIKRGKCKKIFEGKKWKGKSKDAKDKIEW